MGDLVDAGAGLWCQRRQLEVQTFELGAPDRFEPLSQRDDRRNRAPRSEPRGEPLDFFADNRIGACDLARAPREVLANRCLQIVDVVQEHLLDLAGRRLDIARNGDIDDEQRPVPSGAHHRFDVRPCQNRRRGSGRGDDDVGRAEHGVELVPW